MSRLEVHQYTTRSDNYGVLIHDPKTGATSAIDAPDAEEPAHHATERLGVELLEIGGVEKHGPS